MLLSKWKTTASNCYIHGGVKNKFKGSFLLSIAETSKHQTLRPTLQSFPLYCTLLRSTFLFWRHKLQIFENC